MKNSSNTYDLVYTHESGVYSSLGLVSWHFSISGKALTSIVADHRTYSYASSGIPGAQTGNINTTYAHGKLYFARNGGDLYSFAVGAPSNSAPTLEVPSSQFNCLNDFGYFSN